MDKTRLPVGHHWDLHIEHDFSGGNAGSFVGGSGNRLVPHITVSPWQSVDSMVDVLHAKGAEPHVVIGGRPGVKHPVVIQLIPFNLAGRSLVHPPGTPETNRAGDHTVQAEICARPGRAYSATLGVSQLMEVDRGSTLFDFDHPDAYALAVDLSSKVRGRSTTEISPEELAAFELCMHESRGIMLQRAFASGVASWGDDTYKALGNLFELINHRIPFPRRYAHPCGSKRISAKGWTELEGIAGHCVVPGNDHDDPTKDFRGDKTVQYMESAPNEL